MGHVQNAVMDSFGVIHTAIEMRLQAVSENNKISVWCVELATFSLMESVCGR